MNASFVDPNLNLPSVDGFVKLDSRLLAAVVATTVFGALVAMKQNRVRGKLPPGPPIEPFIGSLRSMPSSHMWLTFTEWSKKWGDVIYASVFGAPVIVLGSIDAARDLLDKKGSNFSSRPRSVTFYELLNWDALVSLPYGEKFRKHRRLMSQILNSQAIVVYREFQINNTKGLLKDILREPEKFDQHIFRKAFTTIMRVTYGLDNATDNHDLFSMFSVALKRVVDEGAPGATMIDHFPFLKHWPSWLPGGGFQKRLAITRAYVEDTKDIPFEMTQAERRAGTSKPSLIGNLLDEYDASGTVDPEHVYDLKLVGAVMYAAGVDTSATSMAGFFQFLAMHPEIVKRAQAEIDSVTHQERLPTWDDREKIPIIDCIMKECFRKNPPVPLSIPHASIDDDTYRDMNIPAGSTIIPNIWQMMNDSKYFPNPEVFDPERYREKVVAAQGNSLQALNGQEKDDPSSIVFGFGRRICPGRYFIDQSLWLQMSNILAVFDIRPPLDSRGKPREIGDIKYTDGFTSGPEPFECTITPRNARCATLIQELEVENEI